MVYLLICLHYHLTEYKMSTTPYTIISFDIRVIKHNGKLSIHHVSSLLLRYPVQYNVISVRTIKQKPVYPAYGSGTGPRLFGYLAVSLFLFEHPGHLQPLCQGFDLVHGTQVLKKSIALLQGLKAEYSLKQLVNQFIPDFRTIFHLPGPFI